jgi:hypothetical protein
MAVVRVLLFLMAAQCVAGCAVNPFRPGYTVEVTQFHAGPLPVGSFELVPYDEQRGSLEWRQYAAVVAAHLRTRGFVPATAAVPDYLVFVSYAVDGGVTTAQTVREPVYGTTGGQTLDIQDWQGRTVGTTRTPVEWGITGYETRTVHSTTYTRRVSLQLHDGRRSTPANPVPVYEAKAVSSGSGGRLNEAFPYLVEGIVRAFPGQSGQTVRMFVQE